MLLTWFYGDLCWLANVIRYLNSVFFNNRRLQTGRNLGSAGLATTVYFRRGVVLGLPGPIPDPSEDSTGGGDSLLASTNRAAGTSAGILDVMFTDVLSFSDVCTPFAATAWARLGIEGENDIAAAEAMMGPTHNHTHGGSSGSIVTSGGWGRSGFGLGGTVINEGLVGEPLLSPGLSSVVNRAGGEISSNNVRFTDSIDRNSGGLAPAGLVPHAVGRGKGRKGYIIKCDRFALTKTEHGACTCLPLLQSPKMCI